MMRERLWTRRSVLATATGGFLASFAGCTRQSTPSSGTTQDEGSGVAGDSGVFENVSFDGGSMVVQLPEGHDVTRINLITPNGTGFVQADIPTGATTVQLTILDIKPLSADYEHYTPGVYKLTAVSEKTAETIELDLHPEISITAVESPQDSIGKRRYGQIRVTLRNSGTAPTWIYGIVYRNAPNFAANDQLYGDPGVPQLPDTDRADDAIIGPKEEKSFFGASSPLLFDDSQMEGCDKKEYEFTVVVGTAVGEPKEARLRTTTGGDVVSAGLAGEYTCSEVSTRIIHEGALE